MKLIPSGEGQRRSASQAEIVARRDAGQPRQVRTARRQAEIASRSPTDAGQLRFTEVQPRATEVLTIWPAKSEDHAELSAMATKLFFKT